MLDFLLCLKWESLTDLQLVTVGQTVELHSRTALVSKAGVWVLPF